jgi:hypothetical protein
MRTLRTYLLALLVALSIPSGLAKGTAAASAHVSLELDAGAIKAIRHYRGAAVRLHRVMGRSLSQLGPVRHVSLQRARTIWRRRAGIAWRRFTAGPPHRQAWLCIHRYEGSWRDTNAPYYGGLQMDISFQEHYGGMLLRTEGTADRWTPLEQMWVAEKAYRSGLGFDPWPSTARICGLI